MPTTTVDNDDPILASYDVYIAAKEPHAPANALGTASSKLFLLQYSAHRPQSRPYNAARSQKPTALRLKPETGLIEIDVPILTHEHYNAENGARYQKSLKENQKSNNGGSHGLAGGFNTLHGGPANSEDMRDIPPHVSASESDQELDTQTLGGKIVTPTTRDPIYMLGTFRGDQLHLSHLDALVQVRPQLHHLDAQDELNQRDAMKKMKGGGEGGPPPKLESKAIDLKLKDNKDDVKDRNLNTNARLLRNIQHESWQVFTWTDQDDTASRSKFTETMHLHFPSATGGEPSTTASAHVSHLKSAISNGEWLDKISAPRETGHGKKGLLAKLRGREREKARRKKNDGERRRREKEAGAGAATKGAAATGGVNLIDQGSESSELSSLDGYESEATDAEPELDKAKTKDKDKDKDKGKGKGNDVEMVDLIAEEEEIEIKEEPSSSIATAPAAVPHVPDSLEAEGTGSAPGRPTMTAKPKVKPKPAPSSARRGRSNRNQTLSQLDGTVEIDND